MNQCEPFRMVCMYSSFHAPFTYLPHTFSFIIVHSLEEFYFRVLKNLPAVRSICNQCLPVWCRQRIPIRWRVCDVGGNAWQVVT